MGSVPLDMRRRTPLAAYLDPMRTTPMDPYLACSGWVTLPRVLPRRCALTAPFHPYRRRSGLAVSFLWHFPWAAPPGVTRHPVLWSPDFPPAEASDCLAGSSAKCGRGRNSASSRPRPAAGLADKEAFGHGQQSGSHPSSPGRGCPPEASAAPALPVAPRRGRLGGAGQHHHEFPRAGNDSSIAAARSSPREPR